MATTANPTAPITATSDPTPYTQALAGKAAANIFAGLPADAQGEETPASAHQTALASSSSASSGPPSGSPLIGANLARDLGTQPPIPDDSTKDTPEAATAKQQQTQQQDADVQQINNKINPKEAAAPKLPTEQQDVDAALAPDQAALNALPDEYKSAIAAIQPYISGGQNTGNSALNAADAAVSKQIGTSDNKVEAALAGLGKAGKEFEGTVPYQGIVQAMLGFNKYEESYGGAQPMGQSSWSTGMDEIYRYLSGENASTDGLPAVGTAAAATTVNPATNPATSDSDTAGGGNG
jgi:hypothetical protein